MRGEGIIDFGSEGGRDRSLTLGVRGEWTIDFVSEGGGDVGEGRVEH